MSRPVHGCQITAPTPVLFAAQDADLYSLDVRPGDVLIAATDGLWDNTYDDELLQHLPTSADDLQRVSSRTLAFVGGV
jgi:serine/threonine protein phosphatase PrpC